MAQTIAKNFYQLVKTATKGRYKGIKCNLERKFIKVMRIY